jgi:hypothetical protein
MVCNAPEITFTERRHRSLITHFINVALSQTFHPLNEFRGNTLIPNNVTFLKMPAYNERIQPSISEFQKQNMRFNL